MDGSTGSSVASYYFTIASKPPSVCPATCHSKGSSMRLRIVGLIGLLAGIAGNVHAITCYEIVDASDRTLYRAVVPPFPLEGSAWSTAQTRLRAQGRHLLWFDTNACPEDFSSPAYASTKVSEEATDLLPARRGATAGSIYTREVSSPGNALTQGRAPVVVMPAGAPVTAPSGAAKGYTR
jgi:hypothetical protein